MIVPPSNTLAEQEFRGAATSLTWQFVNQVVNSFRSDRRRRTEFGRMTSSE